MGELSLKPYGRRTSASLLLATPVTRARGPEAAGLPGRRPRAGVSEAGGGRDGTATKGDLRSQSFFSDWSSLRA
jgi:hypothetical protein